MLENNNKRLAVLIDADNAQSDIVENLLAEIAKFGIATTKRIYGDWTTQKLQGWKKVLLQYSIQPIQQFAYTKGKNATDSALIINAMDLLYTDNFDGFCIVSSDSDFTKLAQRIRESGLIVYGFGEQKTPDAFRSACNKFILTEVLRTKTEVDQEIAKKETKNPAEADQAIAKKETKKPAAKIKQKNNQTIGKKTGSELKQDTKLVRLLRNAVDELSGDNDWVKLSPVGSYINRQKQDFDQRNYGYAKLSELFRATGLFDTKLIGKVLHVRDKRKK